MAGCHVRERRRVPARASAAHQQHVKAVRDALAREAFGLGDHVEVVVEQVGARYGLAVDRDVQGHVDYLGTFPFAGVGVIALGGKPCALQGLATDFVGDAYDAEHVRRGVEEGSLLQRVAEDVARKAGVDSRLHAALFAGARHARSSCRKAADRVFVLSDVFVLELFERISQQVGPQVGHVGDEQAVADLLGLLNRDERGGEARFLFRADFRGLRELAFGDDDGFFEELLDGDARAAFVVEDGAFVRPEGAAVVAGAQLEAEWVFRQRGQGAFVRGDLRVEVRPAVVDARPRDAPELAAPFEDGHLDDDLHVEAGAHDPARQRQVRQSAFQLEPDVDGEVPRAACTEGNEAGKPDAEFDADRYGDVESKVGLVLVDGHV